MRGCYSKCISGGLAERTGALHVGDRLLAINGHCLQGRRLSEAVEWLQGAGDRVTLQVSRGGSPVPVSEDGSDEPTCRHIELNPSVDSAVESWSSCPASPGTEFNTGGLDPLSIFALFGIT
jgi:hypothetical protein